MTYEEVKNLKVSQVVIETDLKKLSKTCLSIVDSSTLKDNEILLFINAGIQDLKRAGVDAETHIQDDLIQGAIIMFLKANFGMVDVKEKELCQKRYENLCNNLSLSSEYKLQEENSDA